MQETSSHNNPDYSIIIIGESKMPGTSVGQVLRLNGYSFKQFTAVKNALEWPALKDSNCIIVASGTSPVEWEIILEAVENRNFIPPIIVIAGHENNSPTDGYRFNGIYDFIEEPFDGNVLLSSVSKAIEKAGLTRECIELRRKIEELSSGSGNKPSATGKEPDSGRLLSLPATTGRLKSELERTEKSIIKAALREHDGKPTEACITLGISRRALYERMKKYDLRKEDFRI